MSAWKWMMPRRWNSATLTKDTRARRASSPADRAKAASDDAAQRDGEAAPPLGRVPVEGDVSGVVVAVAAERRAEPRIILPWTAKHQTGRRLGQSWPSRRPTEIRPRSRTGRAQWPQLSTCSAQRSKSCRPARSTISVRVRGSSSSAVMRRRRTAVGGRVGRRGGRRSGERGRTCDTPPAPGRSHDRC